MLGQPLHHLVRQRLGCVPQRGFFGWEPRIVDKADADAGLFATGIDIGDRLDGDAKSLLKAELAA